MELQADVVIFATGFANLHDSVRLVCSNEIAQKVGLSFKLDDDGEQRGVQKDSGQHEGFGLRPETYHHSEHAFEACT